LWVLEGNQKGKEELQEEQRERNLKRRLNQECQSFVKKVEDQVGTLEFDIPYRELGFYGVPFRNNVLLQPTVHCLVNLVEYPFFVLTLEEVQIAYFERVQFSLRNFDLVFVFEDLSKSVVCINAIPVDSLDTIKEWLNSCNIKYYEGQASLNWKRIMQQIREDPVVFWEEGGWNFLEPDAGDEDQERPRSSGKGGKSSKGKEKRKARGDDEDFTGDYVPSGSEEEDYQDVSDSDSDVSAGKKQGPVEDEDQSEEEDEGEDWDALEEQARQDDIKTFEKKRKRGEADDWDGERKRRKTRR